MTEIHENYFTISLIFGLLSRIFYINNIPEFYVIYFIFCLITIIFGFILWLKLLIKNYNDTYF